MHVKDNLVTLNLESNAQAKDIAGALWQLVKIINTMPQFEGKKFTPEQALYYYLKSFEHEFDDLIANPPIIN